MESKPWSGRRVGHVRFRRISHISHTTTENGWSGTAGICMLPGDTAGKGYMGKKDVAGKEFFADKKRFAELFNVILFQGKDFIQPEMLETADRVYPSLTGKGEAVRDVFMKDAERNICYGLELETESDYGMPERVMAYDVCELEHQIKEIARRYNNEPKGGEKFVYREKKSRMKEEDFLLPVVTIVLYLGINHWEGRQKLSEMYRFSEETQELLGRILPDYGFPLAEADFINPDSFRTDLKEFFQVMQCRKDKEKLKKLLKEERFRQLDDDVTWTMAVYLGRKRLTEKMEKEGLGMCPALDELLADERAEGREEGRLEGVKKERRNIIRNMIQQGLDQEFICRVTGCSQQEFVSAAEG